jgi:hypothetical protein
MTKTLTPALDEMLQIIERLDLQTLARLAAHEYDDNAVVPAGGSSGAGFLQACRDDFVRWVRQNGRFPGDPASAATTWHDDEALGSMVVYAYADCAFFYSAHLDAAGGASVNELRKVLDSAAEQFAHALAEEYGPLV